jgi:15-cis-phytoene synthase
MTMPERGPLEAAYAHCEALLRRDDPDRWLVCLFLPAESRHHVHALYAFSHEVAGVGTRVSEALLGEIRFQWWREAIIGEREGETAAHPIAAALVDTIGACHLPHDPLLSLIDARLFDLHDEPMPSFKALEAYAKATASSLFRLAGLIVAGQESDELAAAAEHAGIAYAITGLLRALPWHQSRGRIYLPVDILAAHGMTEDELRAGKTTPALLAALADLRQRVRDHVQKFDAVSRALDAETGAVFLPVRLCEGYVRHMEKPGYDPLHSMIDVPQWRRQWTLWRAARALG